MTDYKKLYRQQCHEALKTLLAWATNPTELGKIANVSRSAVTYWCSTGKVSREGAVALAGHPGCPLTREQIRPDIKVWE